MKNWFWRARLEKQIRAHLENENINIKIYDKIDSTNTEAKRYLKDSSGECPCLFIAREQSAGRGRIGRSFVSRKGRGIYMTLLYLVDKQPSSSVSITTAAAVATATAIEGVTDKPMQIKWVNDIYNERGKVAGILVEGHEVTLGNAVIVGIGINIGREDFPDEIKGIASSIGNIGRKSGKIIANVVDKLLSHLKNPDDKSYMADYRARFMLDGRKVALSMADGGEKRGRVVGVSDDGGLIVDSEGGREVINSGSVSVRVEEGE